MVKKFTYDWADTEDDNIDPEIIKKAKEMTIKEIDEKWQKFINDLGLENV